MKGGRDGAFSFVRSPYLHQIRFRWMEVRGIIHALVHRWKDPPLCQPSVSQAHVQFLWQPPPGVFFFFFWHTAPDSFRIITSGIPWNFLISCSLTVNPGVPVWRWNRKVGSQRSLSFFFFVHACHSPLQQLLFLISFPVICGESICRCFRWGRKPPGRGDLVFLLFPLWTNLQETTQEGPARHKTQLFVVSFPLNTFLFISKAAPTFSELKEAQREQF